jgi:hypothetical protein
MPRPPEYENLIKTKAFEAVQPTQGAVPGYLKNAGDYLDAAKALDPAKTLMCSPDSRPLARKQHREISAPSPARVPLSIKPRSSYGHASNSAPPMPCTRRLPNATAGHGAQSCSLNSSHADRCQS